MLSKLHQAFYEPRFYQDEYIELLRRVNPGMLHRGNVLCIAEAIQNLPTGDPIIEIGTYCGLSVNVIAYMNHVYGRSNTVFSIDKYQQFKKAGMIAHSNITYDGYWDFVKEATKRNVSFFNNNERPFLFESTATDFFAHWETRRQLTDLYDRTVKLGGSISFAYIDGDHSYAGVKMDFDCCDQLLVKGGFLMLDDSADFSGWEVTKLVRQIKKMSRYRVVLKNPNYLFQKIE